MPLYDAFISYSHAKDKPIAAALQSAIQKLGKPWYRRRALRVFRDDTSLSATPHLWPTIERALGQSRFLILLASSEAAVSHWVGKEVAYWLEAKSADTLLIAVTDGALTWDNATNDFDWHKATPLPPALKGRFDAEPKWVDLTAYRDGDDKRDAKFTELAADFAATIRGMPKEDLLSEEVRLQRRALALASSAAGTLLVLAIAAGVAGILAYRAQQEAVAQRNRAEQALTAATQTSNGLVFDLAVRFRNAIGVRATLVKDILDRARQLQDQLTASGQITPALRLSKALALGETAETLLEIGDVASALAAAEQSSQILQALVDADSGNTEWQHDLSISFNKLGDILLRQSRFDGALANYRKSVAIGERLMTIGSGNTVWERDLAVTYGRIGDLLGAQNDVTGALASYRQGLQISERLATSDPTNMTWQSDVSVTGNKIGDVLSADDKLDDALASYRKSMEFAERLVAADSNNAEWQVGLARTQARVAGILVKQGQLDEGLADYRKSIAIMERLVADDPSNADRESELSGIYVRIADLFKARHELDDAQAAYRKGRAIMVRLTAADAKNAAWQRELAALHLRVGDTLAEAGQRNEALESYRAALPIIEGLLAANPGDTDFQWILVAANWKLALAGDDPAARLTVVVATLSRLRDENKLTAAMEKILAAARSRLANLSRQ